MEEGMGQGGLVASLGRSGLLIGCCGLRQGMFTTPKPAVLSLITPWPAYWYNQMHSIIISMHTLLSSALP